MKKIFLVLTLFALSSTAAHSEVDESELMEASPDYVLSLFDSCNVYSEEDGISAAEIKGYVLGCINEELEAGYYLPISSLPKAETEETN